MSTSLTWQILPPHLLQPLLEGVISLVEAAEIWDLQLATPRGQWVPLPKHLHLAAARLTLWRAPAHPMIQ